MATTDYDEAVSIDNLVPQPLSVSKVEGPHLPVHQQLLLLSSDETVKNRFSDVVDRALVGGNPSDQHTVVELEIDRHFHSVFSADVNELKQPSDQAYHLEILADRAKISAPSEAGVFHGIATLRQLVETNRDRSLSIPQCVVDDSPRYPWRGLSMDVARSFYPVDEIKRLIDVLGFYRLNVLHMHLSDDQGWRLQVPGLPRLTELSGATSSDGGRGGFYTTKQFADLVEYGRGRGVALVPEFDSPGHTNAAAHAYGELMPDGEPVPSYSGIEVGFSKLYPEVPFTKEFLMEIINTAAEQSGNGFVHVGGDEALEQDIEDYRLLVREAAGNAAANGKKVVAWQEAATAQLPPGSVVQFWKTHHDAAPMAQAVKDGYKVLMSPASRTYFDMKYSPETEAGQEWAGMFELKQAYQWDPAKFVPGVVEGDIVGVEGGIWTEKIHTFDQLTYMLLPRLAAMAEVAWTGQSKRNWDDFGKRIAGHKEYWEAAGLNWHPSPGVNWA